MGHRAAPYQLGGMGSTVRSLDRMCILDALYEQRKRVQWSQISFPFLDSVFVPLSTVNFGFLAAISPSAALATPPYASRVWLPVSVAAADANNVMHV